MNLLIPILEKCVLNKGGIMFVDNTFISHSGLELKWKIECDHLTDEDLETLAKLIADKFKFRCVVSIPSGGDRFSLKLIKYTTLNLSDPILIVDDVLTTGKSMNKYKSFYRNENVIGVVIFARRKCPRWVFPIFTLNKDIE